VDRSKYNARKTEVDGHTFDSQAEARRYGELKLMAQAGEIRDLELQHKYPLIVNEIKIGCYICDFIYHDTRTGQVVVEDVKGVKTAVYQLKKKLMFAIHHITIVEVSA
jgi:hypothetical protein